MAIWTSSSTAICVRAFRDKQNTMERVLVHTVSEEEYRASENHSLRRFLSVDLHLSRHSISRLKFSDSLFINDQPAHVSMNVKPGDQIRIILERDAAASTDENRKNSDGIAEKRKIRELIRYEDEDLLIVNKPAGMPVHASHGHLDDSLGTLLQKEYQEKGSDFTVRAIGRLDKDVSGLVLFAKNRFAAQILWEEKETGKLSKTYLAIAEGTFEHKEGVIDLPLQKVTGQRRRVTDEEGKPSFTRYCVLRSNGNLSLLEVQIDTGRTHQIRSHLSAIGHPLVGDDLYGGSISKIKRPALHCSTIRAVQPFTENTIVIKEDLPEDMQRLLTSEE